MTQSPIAAAVAPQKARSVEMSVAFVRGQLERFTASLLGKNLTEVAPFPRGGFMSRKDYKQAESRYYAARRLMVTEAQGNRVHSPVIAVAVNELSVATMLEQAAEMAGGQFDSYVAKLEGKVGACDAATVEGYVWNGSVLTVTKGATVERWSTKQIINTSSLGNPYNQWPTRLIK
jgi:hypothetical protein